MASQLLKIRFRLDPKDWHGHGGEFVWAEPIGEASSKTFRVLNSPFFARGLGYYDLVRAHTLWEMLRKQGCSYESMEMNLNAGRRQLLSVDVPPAVDIHEVHKVLQAGEAEGVWMFQEGYAHLPDAGTRDDKRG